MKRRRKKIPAPTGVVAFHAQVRRRIASEGGLSLALASTINERLEAVRAWCAKQGHGLDALPPMTRRAVEQLTRLVIEAAEGKGRLSKAGVALSHRAACSLSGLTKTVSNWLDRLAASHSPTAQALFQQDAEAWLAGIRTKLARRGYGIPDLSLSQQRLCARVEAWCESPWVSVIPHSAEIFEKTLVRASSPAFFGIQLARVPVVRYLPLDGRLWQSSRRAGVPVFSISELFLLDTQAEIPLRLAQFLLGQAGRSSSRERRVLRDWIHSEEVVEYILRLERDSVPGRAEARGIVRDLEPLWQRINERDFGGKLVMPGLAWSSRLAHCRTGYYDAMTNLITISSALDDASIPEYVLDFVLYHEMLHQFDRLDILRGRGRVHDACFRERERSHAHYLEAEAFLHRLAQRR